MVRFFLSLPTLATVALLCSTAAFGQVNYAVEGDPEPVEVDGWDGEAIRITFDGVGDLQNGVTFDNAIIGDDYAIMEFDFEFRIWNEDGLPDADGMGFAFADVNVFGESAEDDQFPNYSGEEANLQGSIGVGFDTWMNSAIDDPDAGGTYPDATIPNSFSLHYDGQVLLTVPMQEYDLPEDWIQSPSVKRAHIEIIPGDDEAFVTVQVTDTESNQTVTAFDGEPVPGFIPYDGRMTFRSRTGGENSNHDIDNISLTRTGPDDTTETVVHYGQHVGPGTGIRGDFNDDGILDAADINDLTLQSAGGTNPEAYDLNSDGVVNADDVAEWINAPDIYDSWVGDADLNHEFNSGDLVAVLASGTYENDVESVWTSGDFDGSGRTNSGDLVAALAGGGYENGLRPAAAAVPEPASAALLLLGSLLLVCRRRN